jgi:hypothetical protein
MSDLVERLLGVYRVPITDGLGPAGGDEPDNENYFVQTFPTTPIQVEAAREIERLWAENEALRKALKPFAEMCADVESCAAEYPADHPASKPDGWFTGFEWDDLLRARALYEAGIK